MKLSDLATGSDWTVWIVFVIFAVLSIILLSGHGSWFISFLLPYATNYSTWIASRNIIFTDCNSRQENATTSNPNIILS